MQVFDFDNTLYHGESAVDFALFMIKRNKKIILWLPTIFYNLLKYKLCLVDAQEMQDTIDDFLQVIIRDKQEIIKMTNIFWKRNRKKLNRRIISKIRKGDVIITAGPSFLIKAICSELGGVRLVCSEVDLDRKKVVYLNFGRNKVNRFRELYGECSIDRFYTDSYNDKAMMDISEKVYLVGKKGIKRIKQ